MHFRKGEEATLKVRGHTGCGFWADTGKSHREGDILGHRGEASAWEQLKGLQPGSTPEIVAMEQGENEQGTAEGNH